MTEVVIYLKWELNGNYLLELLEVVGLGDSCFLFSIFFDSLSICRAFETLDGLPRFGLSC